MASQEAFNHELFKRLGEQGYLGVTVPEEYGGTGLDATASAIVHEVREVACLGQPQPRRACVRVCRCCG